MGTLTALMHVATGALAANQAAISATAENISNQNTVGYTRRAVSWAEGDVVSLGSGSSPGVRSTITAQRDRVLQRTVLNASETAAASSTRLVAVNQLQDLFKLDSSGNDAAGIGVAISSLFNAALSLSTTPNDTSNRQTLYQAAGDFATVFRRAAGQLQSQSASLNGQVSASVDQVNTLSAQVAVLNGQIAEASSDETRDALLDQRSGLVTQISGLIDVSTVQTERDGVSLTLSDGTSLVSGTGQTTLAVGTVSGKARIFAAQPGSSLDVTGAIRGGSIGGALKARDTDIASVAAQLDQLATSVAAAINMQNTVGTDTAGHAGTAVFSGSTAATLTLVASGGDSFALTGVDGIAGSNARALGGLQSAGIVNGNTPAAAFSTMLQGLGNAVSAVQVQSASDAAILTQTTTQLDAVSGVSLDQEAANLTQYQRSYQAAAKVLSIVNELLAQAINLGQPTAVN